MKECVWRTDSDECKGNVKDRAIFNNQLSIPICDKHFFGHKQVMFLHYNGYVIGEIIGNRKNDENWIEKEIQRLINMGLDFDNFNEV